MVSKVAPWSDKPTRTRSQVVDRPVYPWDLVGSMYALLGIDPDGNIQHPQGMEVALLPKASDGVEVGGRLKEIM